MKNPFRMSLVPDVDRADVEKHRIHEEEETKRRVVEAREKTKQTRLQEESFWLVRGLSWAVLGVACLCVAGATCEQIDKTHPNKSCTETVNVINESDTSQACTNGWFSSEPVPGKPGQVLVRCNCGPKPIGK